MVYILPTYQCSTTYFNDWNGSVVDEVVDGTSANIQYFTKLRYFQKWFCF